MKLSLVVMTTGKMEGKVLEIKLPQFLIGRDADCQLRPASPLISKRHCAIIQRDDQVFVQDFGSTNGTHVNDQPIEGEVEVNDGDVLKVGPIQFAIRLESAVAPSALVQSGETIKTASKVPDRAAKVAGMDPRKRAAMEARTIPSPESVKPAAPAAPGAEVARKKAPVPQKSTADSADDDIAAMLMSLGDDSTSGALSGNDIPDGSTVHDLKVPDGVLDKAGGDKKPTKDELAKVKAAQANTSTAAKDILDKYLKRPRS